MITEKNDTLKHYRNSKQFSIHYFLQSLGVWQEVDLLGSFVSFSTLPLLYYMKTTALLSSSNLTLLLLTTSSRLLSSFLVAF